MSTPNEFGIWNLELHHTDELEKRLFGGSICAITKNMRSKKKGSILFLHIIVYIM